jgi:hypothetical protein
MRASIRRIDLTQSPTAVDVWPSIDWMCADHSEPKPGEMTMEAERLAGPRGRAGLWSAMASAVARAREASTGSSSASTTSANCAMSAAPKREAKVIDLAVEAPHLAYLARVARDADHEDAADADVIVFEDYRTRDIG